MRNLTDIIDDIKSKGTTLGHRSSELKEVIKNKTYDNVLKWKNNNPKEFLSRNGVELLDYFHKTNHPWHRRRSSALPTTEVPASVAFKKEIESHASHHKSLSFNRFLKLLDEYKEDKAYGHEFSAVMGIEEAVTHWVEENPKESKNRNGQEVMLPKGGLPSQVQGPVDRLLNILDTLKNQFRKTAPTFCVFNIGTGHSRWETHNIMVKLWKATKSQGNQCCHVNHGPGYRGTDLVGGALGHGMQMRKRATVNMIKFIKPTKVIIVGHSRGAILSYLIAHELDANITVHIFNIDPVAQTQSGSKNERSTLAKNVRSHVLMLMENVVSGMYPLTLARAVQGAPLRGATPYVGAPTESRTQIMPMPGSHGSATQTGYNGLGDYSIGQAAKGVILRWLQQQGVTVFGLVPTEVQLCRDFFKIHQASPLVSGGKSRELWDEGKLKTQERGRKSGLRKKGLHDVIQSAYKGRTREMEWTAKFTKWTATKVFINHYHEDLFKNNWPMVHRVVFGNIGELPIRQFQQYENEYNQIKSQNHYCPAINRIESTG